MTSPSSPARAYAVAAVAVALATAIKVAGTDALGTAAPFALLGLAVITSGWLGGPRSAFAASGLAVFAGWYLFLPPSRSFAIHRVETFVTLCTLAAESTAIAFIISRMHAARALAELSAERLQRIQTLVAALAAARTPEDVAALIVRHGVDVLSASAGIFARPVLGGALEIAAHRGLTAREIADLARLLPDDADPAARAFRSGEPEWIEDQAEYERRYPGAIGDAKGAVAASVALPLALDGRSRAVLTFRFDRPRTFTPTERALMQTLASQAAQALARAELYAEEISARKRLETLDELTEALSAAVTRAEVAKVVVERGMTAAAADTCTLYALDERDGSLTLVADRGVSASVLDRIRRIDRDSSNPVVRSIASGEMLWAESEADYAALYPSLVAIKTEGPRAQAFWSVPLVTEGKVSGLLGMGFYTARRFPPSERTFVETFARHCAEAMRRAERVEAEQEARMLAERLRGSLETTLRSIGDAVIATDARGAVTLMNPIAEDLTGWAEEEARGKSLTEIFRIVNEHTRRDVENPVDKVLCEGVVVGLANHTVLLHKSGQRETPIDDSGAPIRGEGGRIEGVVLVFRDVSAKKREEARRGRLAEATAALSASLDYEATLAHVARLAVPALADWCSVDIVEEGQRAPRSLAVAHVDPDKVEHARQLGRLYPSGPNDARGIANVLRTGVAELYPDLTDAMLVEGASDAEHLRMLRELELRSAMIVPLPARGSILGAITFVYAESGRVYGEEDLAFAEELARRCAVALDNARLYAAEQRARQRADVASSAKDEFLAMVSHELRTPLNAIMGWARMLSAGLEEAKRARAVATIERNAVAMAQLIEDLLDISRIISGKMRLEVQPVDLVGVVAAAIETVRPAADAKEIRVSHALDPAGGRIMGDGARLQQVVWNLLSNAVKFTPQGGRVDLELCPLDAAVEIRITDSGKGIDPRFLPHVFDPFRQEDASHTRSRGGLGLGLAITRQLVELHGGQIEAASDGEGRGAKFVVRLPRGAGGRAEGRADDMRPLDPPQSLEKPSQLRGLCILVVDDDDDARQLIKTVLEECGSRVVTVASVEEAMAYLGRELPDVLISDIGMPGQDGYDLIRQVRALPAARGGDLPAAALTAYASSEDRRRALNAGYSMHVPKPVEPNDLVAVVASMTRFSVTRGDA